MKDETESKREDSTLAIDMECQTISDFESKIVKTKDKITEESKDEHGSLSDAITQSNMLIETGKYIYNFHLI